MNNSTTVNQTRASSAKSGSPALQLRRLALLLLVATALGGCGIASKSAKPSITRLYNGPSSAVYETLESPKDAESALKRADYSTQLGNIDEALYYYVKTLEFDPGNRQALNRIGDIHLERENYDPAEAAYRLALSADPKNANALMGLGLIQYHHGKDTDAAQSLSAALSVDPKLWRARSVLGLLADRRGEHAAAAQEFSKALQIQPNNPAVLNNLGYSKYLSGDLSGSLQMFDLALMADPKYPSAWLNKGLVYARLNNEQAALGAFKRVLPEADAYNNLGYIWMMDGRTDAAYECFQRAISLSPTYHLLAHENLKRLDAMNQ
ncbi:tetratricopeptide repeat protein [Methyloterricola oryzae]|uniref:tetratricopeptide repeat protein n=1 Tax=Methyloterricola oryzae TaxID=1495050 RepID=UPI0005EB8ABA|nr:tetratricopeptide repeat protein [Methyloterricola oryzae]